MNPWKYWAPSVLFIFISGFAWLILRSLDVHYEILIWVCLADLILLGLLLVFAIIPIYHWIRRKKIKSQEGKLI
jgi:hypothetical protein